MSQAAQTQTLVEDIAARYGITADLAVMAVQAWQEHSKQNKAMTSLWKLSREERLLAMHLFLNGWVSGHLAKHNAPVYWKN